MTAMVVGDSISHGSAGDFTWRYRFFEHETTTAGVDLDLVGPSSDLYDNVAGERGADTYADPDFDRDHDAIWGRQLGSAADEIGDSVTAHQPDYLLVLLGINDLSWGVTDPAGTEASLRRFIENARTARPDIRMVFSTLLPNERMAADADHAADVADYNNRLTAVVTELTSAQSPLVLADGGADFVAADDTWDGLHPNASGEAKIAAAFADALATSPAGFGTSYPRPYPDVPLGPQTPPELSVRPGAGEAHLSWVPSPGATGYYVYVKNVTEGETSFTKLPYPVPGSSWTAGLLTNGSTYEFRLGATKGSEEGVKSNVVTATPTVAAPAGVTDLAATPGDGQVELAWTQVEDAAGYYVWVKDPGDAEFHRLPYPVPGPSWTAGLLTAGGRYEFKLESVNGLVKGGMSNIVAVTVGGTTPPAVTDLSVTAGNHKAVLAWTNVSHATGYYVWVKDPGATEFKQLPYAVAGPSWTAASLRNGSTYQYKIQSINGALRGNFSNTVSVTPTGPAPAGVTDLTIEPGNGEATLTWSKVEHATGYYVQVRNVTAGESDFRQLPYPVSGPTWTAGLLASGATYEFKLRSINDSVLGGYSNTVRVVVGGSKPAGPGNLSVSAGNRAATLSWTKVSAATGYYVYVRNVSAGEDGFTQLPHAVPGPSWTASGLVAGASYQFKLQSINDYIRGGFSNTVSVTVSGTTPSGTSLSVSPGNRRATLSWTSETAATGYYVHVRNVSAGETGFKELPYPVTGTSWTDTGLVAGAQYQFKLQSVNGYIRGGFSNTVTTTVGGTTPDGPTLSVASGNRRATLSWTAEASATGYYVYVRNVSTGEDSFTRLPYALGGTGWTATGLVAGARYEFKMRSVNGYIWGGYSNTASVTVGGTTPDGPTSLTASPGDGKATLRWTPAASATGYYVYVRNVSWNASSFTKLPYPVTGSSWTATLLIPGATYEFKLRSVNGLIEGGYSGTTRVVASGSTPSGVTDLRATAGMNEATLKWTRVSSATGYYIYMRPAGTSEFTQLTYAVSGPAFTAGLLRHGQTYEFRLQSVNGMVRGGYSNIVSVTIGLGVETLPGCSGTDWYYNNYDLDTEAHVGIHAPIVPFPVNVLVDLTATHTYIVCPNGSGDTLFRPFRTTYCFDVRLNGLTNSGQIEGYRFNPRMFENAGSRVVNPPAVFVPNTGDHGCTTQQIAWDDSAWLRDANFPHWEVDYTAAVHLYPDTNGTFGSTNYWD